MAGGKGMEFAASFLSKFGWKEGQGLGKHETGITEALRPKLKFDLAGVGHKVGDAFTNNWWEQAFNTAADNININKAKDGTVSMNANSDFEISTHKVSSRKRKGMVFNNFMKAATLTNEGTIVEEPAEDLLDSITAPVIPTLTDDELFKACGSRTAHKGARHGLGLNGKLVRIEEQERLLLLRYQSTENTSEPSLKKRRKSKKKQCINEDLESLPIGSEEEAETQQDKESNEMISERNSSQYRKKKKSKRKAAEDLESLPIGSEEEAETQQDKESNEMISERNSSQYRKKKKSKRKAAAAE